MYRRPPRTGLWALLIVVALLAGCGGGQPKPAATDTPAAPQNETGQSTATQPPEPAAPQPAELRILWWGNQDRHDRTLQALDAYSAKNTHVTFTPEFTAWTNYFDKVSVLAASSSMPDILQMDYKYLLEYTQRGALYDLTPTVGSALKLDTMSQGLLDAGKVDGKLYAVCLGSNVPVMQLNKTLLGEAGLPVPSLDWTWTDFEDYARKVREKLGPNVWLSTDFSDDYSFFEHWVRQQGRPGIYDGKGQLAVTEADVVSWFTFWDRLRTDGLIPGPELAISSGDKLENYLFVKRQSILHRAWSNEHERFVKVLQDELAMIPLPRGGQAEGHYPKCSLFFSVSAGTQQPEEAARFINWFINDPEALGILQSNRGNPVTPEARQVLKQGADELAAKVFDIEEKIIQFAATAPPPPPKGGSEVLDLFENRIAQEVMFGRKTPAQAARDFMAEAAQILQKAAAN